VEFRGAFVGMSFFLWGLCGAFVGLSFFLWGCRDFSQKHNIQEQARCIWPTIAQNVFGPQATGLRTKSSDLQGLRYWFELEPRPKEKSLV
jgi:hypothetical protein